jgi:hypothetical protein
MSEHNRPISNLRAKALKNTTSLWLEPGPLVHQRLSIHLAPISELSLSTRGSPLEHWA